MARIFVVALIASLGVAFSACATDADWARVRAQKTQAASNQDKINTYIESQRAAHTKSLVHPQTRKFTEAMALPDEQFDFSLALWLFAREYHNPNIDVEAGLERVDNWRRELDTYITPERTPEERLEILRTYIHVDLGFAFDDTDPNGYHSENLFIDSVIQRRRGYCVTLSMIYLLLAPSAGLEAAGCYVPAHFGVMVKMPDRWVFVESTASGQERSFASIEVKHRMSKASRDTYHVYLSPLTPKEFFSALYNNLGALKLIERSRADVGQRPALLRQAEIYLRQALTLSATNTDANLNLAMALAEGGSAAEVRQALGLVNEVLKWDVNSYNGLVARASILDRYGDATLAKKDLRRAKGIMPKRPDAWVIEGNIALREKRLADAKSAYEEAIALDANNFRALNNLAVVEEELGNFARAKELTEKVRSLVEKSE